MFVSFDKEKLRKILSDFSAITEINIAVYDENLNILCSSARGNNKYCSYIQSTKTGPENCKCSDLRLIQKCRRSQKEQIHICHAGLIDAAAPLMYENTIIGYLILGQMKKDTEFKIPNEYINESCPDYMLLKQVYDELPLFEKTKIESIINIAVMLAKYILLEKILWHSSNEAITKATKYINNHLSENLSIKKLADVSGYSSSALYNAFRRSYGCTVGEYITEKRIESAVCLLLETDFTIEEISRRTGFCNAPYFSSIFKQKMTVSPSEFRKSNTAKSSSNKYANLLFKHI